MSRLLSIFCEDCHLFCQFLLSGEVSLSLWPIMGNVTNLLNHSCFIFYRTRVQSLFTLVTNSFTDWLTNWLTNCCLVDLIDVTMACEDADSKLVEVVLLLMLIMRIVLATVCCRFGRWCLVIKLNFCSDFEHKVWSRFWSWSSGKIWSRSLVSILLLMFCRGNEVESWSRFWSHLRSISFYFN